MTLHLLVIRDFISLRFCLSLIVGLFVSVSRRLPCLCLSLPVSICLSMYPTTTQSSRVSLYPPTYLSIYLSIYLSFYLSLYPPIRLMYFLSSTHPLLWRNTKQLCFAIKKSINYFVPAIVIKRGD